MNLDTEKCRNYIARNMLANLFDLLLEFADSEESYRNKIILNANRYNQYVEEVIIGIVSDQNELRSVLNSVLYLIDEIEKDQRYTEYDKPETYGQLEKDTFFADRFDDVNLPILASVSTDRNRFRFADSILNSFERRLERSNFVNTIRLICISDNDFSYSPDLKIELLKIRESPKFTWYEKSITVSAISLRLQKLYDSNWIQELIKFAYEFEKEVWDRAIVAILLAVNTHMDEMLLDKKIVSSIYRICEINEVRNVMSICLSISNFRDYDFYESFRQGLYAHYIVEEQNEIIYFVPFVVTGHMQDMLLENEIDSKIAIRLQDNSKLSSLEKYLLMNNVDSYSPEEVNTVFGIGKSIDQPLYLSQEKEEFSKYINLIRDYYVFQEFTRLNDMSYLVSSMSMEKLVKMKAMFDQHTYHNMMGEFHMRNTMYRSACYHFLNTSEDDEISKDVLTKIIDCLFKMNEIDSLNMVLEQLGEDVNNLKKADKLRMAKVYLHNYSFDKSVGIYEAILVKEPKHVEALFHIGIAYYGLKLYQKSIDSWLSLMEAEGKDVYLLVKISDCYKDLGKLDVANKYLSEAFKVSIDSKYNAVLLRKFNNLKKAIFDRDHLNFNLGRSLEPPKKYA